MKKRVVAATVVALAVTVGSGAWLTGNVNAAEAVQKITAHFGGKGAIRAAIQSTELSALLGMTSDELESALKAGKSLAAVAGAKGVDVQKVIDLEIKTLTAELDKQLKNGRITQEEYDTRKASIAATAKEIVSGTFKSKDGSGHRPFDAAVLTSADIAKLLGLTSAELGTQLKSGKSLAALAAAKGVSVQDVIDLEAKAITAALDQRLKDGEITQTQYDNMKANAAAWAAKVVNGTFAGKGRGGENGWRRGFGHADVLEDAALASLLGMTTDELESAVKSGKSLATIAGEKKVAVQAVTDQVTKVLTAELDKRLADGAITQAQYDQKKAALAAQAAEIVNGSLTGKGGHGKGGHGPRGGHGFGGGHRKEGAGTADSGTTTSA